MRTIRALIGWAGLFLIAGMGAATGNWVVRGDYPFQTFSRKVLTPVVKPGDDAQVEIDGYRSTRCPIEAVRIYQYPGRVRDETVTVYKPEFGRLGHDKFVIKIPTDPSAKFGKVQVYSYGRSRCNPWEWVSPKYSGDPFLDEFELGPATIFRSPDDVKPDERFVRE